MSRLVGFAALALSLCSTTVYAHIQLDYPPARVTAQKTGPCGSAGSVRGTNITELRAGEPLVIRWRETINHPGHYRISFDDDGDDDFIDPASFTDFYTNSTVLHDNIGDKAGGAYEFEMTVPNIACSNCTIQLVQVMTDKAPYGDGNDLYYQCADIVIVKDGDDMGTPDMGADMAEVDMEAPGPGPDPNPDPDLDPTPDMGPNPTGDDMGPDAAPGGNGSTSGEGSACQTSGSSGPLAAIFWMILLTPFLARRRTNRVPRLARTP